MPTPLTSPPTSTTPGLLTRRRVLSAGAAAAATVAAGRASQPVAARAAAETEAVADLETQVGARIGLVARNLRTGRSLQHRADERAPLCSTFKPLVAAALLSRGVDLDQVLRYRGSDVVANSPVTGSRRAMTVGELADAAIRYSDNTAGNLLLRRLGGADGPAALTRYLRTIGDDVTRLDRWETELNEAVPGDPRDTTTPRALARTYQRLLVGRGLGTRDRWVLQGWMQSNTTSVEKLRAALPVGWWCADKTGGGSYGTQNDVGLITAPDGTRIVFAILTRGSLTDPGAVGSPTLMRSIGHLLIGRLG